MSKKSFYLSILLFLLCGVASGQTIGGPLEYDLTLAVVEGDAEQVNTLLAKGADINTKDGQGTTVLMEASREGRTAVAKILLQKGAQINLQNNRGLTAHGSRSKRPHGNS